MKILYACGNNIGANTQLHRFLQAIENKNYQIKIASYRQNKYLFNVDWTLNCLHNYFDKEKVSLDNEYFFNYYYSIKSFNPDLIISDLEYFTSYIALDLNIPLWQCSSRLLNYALPWHHKYGLSIFSNYSYLLYKQSTQKYNNIIDNSNLNLVYSHFGEINNPPKLKDSFEWVRPYTFIGNKSIPCKHNIVAVALSNNKKIYNTLNQINDCVIFSANVHEKYSNLIIKDIYNDTEYKCNLANCNFFLCEGEATFLSDAFYNKKYTLIMPNLKDTECTINSMFSEKSGLSKNIYSDSDFSKIEDISVNYCLNDKICYLHERLEKI